MGSQAAEALQPSQFVLHAPAQEFHDLPAINAKLHLLQPREVLFTAGKHLLPGVQDALARSRLQQIE
jgi:hypothetical protein